MITVSSIFFLGKDAVSLFEILLKGSINEIERQRLHFGHCVKVIGSVSEKDTTPFFLIKNTEASGIIPKIMQENDLFGPETLIVTKGQEVQEVFGELSKGKGAIRKINWWTGPRWLLLLKPNTNLFSLVSIT